MSAIEGVHFKVTRSYAQAVESLPLNYSSESKRVYFPQPNSALSCAVDLSSLSSDGSELKASRTQLALALIALASKAFVTFYHQSLLSSQPGTRS